MNRTLFEIADEILNSFYELNFDEETGEITNPEVLDNLNVEFESKATNIGLLIQEIEGNADLLKSKRQSLQERENAMRNKSDRLKDYLKHEMQTVGKTKIENENIRLSFRKSEQVSILDETQIPKEYLNEKITITPDKTLIKQSLKKGLEVPGTTLKENQNLQIK